ncbi:MAG: transposase [Candidatus Binatia bacterium]
MIQGLPEGAKMTRKVRVQRTPEEKWEIVQEGLRSGNIAETCRRYGIAPNLYYRWKDEAEQGAKAALGGKSAAAVESEKDRRLRQLERSLGRKTLEVEILKTLCGSELRGGSLPRPGAGRARLPGDAGGGGADDQPLQPLLPEAAPGQPG